MDLILLDGKKVRDEILRDLNIKITKEKKDIVLAIIYIGSNGASDIYVNNKRKYAEQVGIKANLFRLDNKVSKEEVEDLILRLNKDNNVHGIILQSPIPSHLPFNYLSNLILPYKDVDGFSEHNVYANYTNNKALMPCTVRGIIRLLDYYNIELEGKEVVIVGRSNIVGKPLGLALLNKNATITIA